MLHAYACEGSGRVALRFASVLEEGVWREKELGASIAGELVPNAMSIQT